MPTMQGRQNRGHGHKGEDPLLYGGKGDIGKALINSLLAWELEAWWLLIG